MQAKIKFNFSGKLWKFPSKGGWFFVSLPKELSSEIRTNLQWQEEGWGRLKVSAVINNLSWDTAIWFDKKHETYLLPIKATVRKKNNLKLDDVIKVTIIV